MSNSNEGQGQPRSEKEAGHRNAALVNFLKSFGNIKNNVDDVLDAYFHQCAICMNCRQLAHAALFLANQGTMPLSNQRFITSRQAKRIYGLMVVLQLLINNHD